MRKKLCVAVASVLVSLTPLWYSCSNEEPQTRREGANRPADARATTTGTPRPGSAAEEGVAPVPREEEPPASLVPIVHLTSSRESVGVRELAQNADLTIPEGSLDSAQRLLDRERFETLDSAEAVVERVSRTPSATGLVPWDAVGPEVRALAVGGEGLLDPEAGDISDYPLGPEGGAGPDPERLRRLVIGGDVTLDRGQNYMVLRRGMGLDFPMDGGFAAITGRVPEPSSYSETGIIHQFTAARAGDAGAVREYLSGADLTLANFENPVVRNAVYHPEEPYFTGDLRLMPILDQAGIDGVTLGNNHVLDAGASGLEETLGHLDEAGIARAGAGMNLAEAREPMIFDVGGTRIGVLSHLSIPGYEFAWATETTAGTAPLREDVLREDIARLRPKVDLVVVMPHWGREYLATPEPGQVDLAHAAVEAGADLIVGGHAHWPKGIELYEEAPIFYGVGNFLLDQSWSEETSTGIFAEVTLYGDEIVQVRPVPFVLLDYAQPNFLLPEAGGDRALGKIYAASLGPEFEAYEDR